MVTQVATLKRADEHCFKPKFQGISGLLEKPLSLLEVGEAKGNVSPTFFPADYRPSAPCPLLWWVDELWWRSNAHHRGSTQLFTHMDGEQYHQPQGAMSGAVYSVGSFMEQMVLRNKILVLLYGEAGNHHQTHVWSECIISGFQAKHCCVQLLPKPQESPVPLILQKKQWLRRVLAFAGVFL